jgi:tRNA A-37 threonylcarbamoyl transferase component Bud32
MKTLEMIKNLAERNTVVASADVLVVFAALEKSHQRIGELESQLQSGFTPEALAQEERAENAEQRVAELEFMLRNP